RPFLRWRGPDPDDGTESTDDLRKLRPGDTIVVPSSYGGCDEFGWDPLNVANVEDVADVCSWRAKKRPVLRVHRTAQIHETAIAAWSGTRLAVPTDAARLLKAFLSDIDANSGETDWEAVRASLQHGPHVPEWLRRAKVMQYPDDSSGNCPGLVFVGRRPTD